MDYKSCNNVWHIVYLDEKYGIRHYLYVVYRDDLKYYKVEKINFLILPCPCGKANQPWKKPWKKEFYYEELF